MILANVAAEGSLRVVPVTEGHIPAETVWLDLVSPTEADDALTEAFAGISVPTREEMGEIEQSSRLYMEGGARYMTASVLCGADTETPVMLAVTFILSGGRLITVRYGEPKAFPTVAGRLGKACPAGITGEALLIELLEAIVDRAADVLEQIGSDVERISKRIFDRSQGRENSNQRYRAILSHIGRKEGLVSYARESLASLQRLLSFLGTETDGATVTKDAKASVKSMSRDVAGLSDYANFLGDKLQFLLDATIGMVGLEQNNIIKIFAVLSVVLMPPTLIASIYGMNFQHMPELDWTYAYPAALVGMVISGILPYLFFKWRRWL
ncbi:magnesium transporter CorA family protein [Xanthobacter dioxanivorans]|uniref:Magnesium transport protein CorA n=1 Tax=Xanthobacter dioxanivorans TaxID=2528964 RepID=A0A974SKI4_9HYPH|nr:magnesium transporter CorA family protein [Xanthobacter dioxanivorans]QRG08512.1 magnesium transporter CorA family protein [Xanthobacter dioxanivorans]